jgi:type II secretory pathway pseudopilin PulG
VSDERGFTVVELMVGMMVGLLVLSAILGLVQVTSKNQARVATRVAANQRARPVMTRIIDQLHSACVSPGVAPVQPGSSDNTLIFISKSGSEVSPTPERHVVAMVEGDLKEFVYPAVGGAAPDWTFSSTPSSVRSLLSGISAGLEGDPAQSVPVFRYYAYVGGQVSTTPQATPLSGFSAARTVQVTVSFATPPTTNPTNDELAAITLSDSVTLRLEPASEDSAEVNLPCV